MGLLILVGSGLSYLLNQDSKDIAIASFAAFALAGTADAIAYHLLGKRKYILRVNGSNIVGAVVDSLVFPYLAFGGFLPLVVAGQFLAKVSGGLIWSLFLRRV